MQRRSVLILSALCVFPCLAGADTLPPSPPQRAVLVTGASSGIGRKVTERLTAAGYFVYATARKDADIEALGRMKNVQPLRLDVTSPQDIAAAVEVVTKAGRGLHGLVNNAGIGTGGPVLDSKLEEFELAMNVNALGPVRITRAFAPLIVAAKGRIVNISSVSGILAGENTSAYAMSKHAVEAFTDSLALEMQKVGVQVSAVEPGNYNTQIIHNAAARLGITSRLNDRPSDIEPDAVAAAVEHALFAPDPKRRYLVVPNEPQAQRTIRKQIAQLVELNEGQGYTYDRATLIKMLDEALAGSRPRTQ
jgi:NAD(P)-dependent dehydrogenase (short-subunit alcohol dehydrogenase family)